MDLETPFLAAMTPEARGVWDRLQGELRREPGRLAVILPQLPRRLGRQAVGSGRLEGDGAVVDLAAWRVCDVAAALLFRSHQTAAAALLDLFAHGDMEERAMVLRSLGVLATSAGTRALLDEVQRTNTLTHVEAALLDNNLLARAVADGVYSQAEANRTLLKLAFLDLPLARVLGAETLANPELSRMLQDLATEREAAGRAVWRDTCRLIARAPTAGSLGRLAGALEHGDDGHRLAAAEGLVHVGSGAPARPFLLELARERLPREPRADVRTALERALNAS